MDNIFIERLWRSIKYEEVHLKAYADGCEARSGISSWMNFYNFRRPHQAMNNQMPMALWRAGMDKIEAAARAVDMPLRLDNANPLPPYPQQRQKHQEAAGFLKDKGRRDYTLNPTTRGPTNGVQFIAWVEETIEETLTFYRLPRQHHKHLKSTNMLERLNEEIRRRTYVVRIFPNSDACRRLVRALAVETHENWLEAHRYLNMNDLKEHKKSQLRQAA